MKIKIYAIGLLLLLIAGNLHSQVFRFSIIDKDGKDSDIAESNQSKSNQGEEAKEYDIEFLESEDSNLGDIIRFRGDRFEMNTVPSGKAFFRLRRIGENQANGFWSQSYSINDFIKKEIIEIAPPDLPEIAKNDEVFLELEKNGKPVLFLNGKSVAIQPKSDSQSKIDETRYRLNNGEWKPYNQKSLEFEKDGEYQMDYYSIDILGNREETKSVIFLVDNIPPTTRIILPQYLDTRDEKTYVSGKVDLTIESFDEVSGVEKTVYRIKCDSGKSSEYKTYADPFPIQSILDYCSGDSTIEFFSIDKVGNRERTKTMPIFYGK